MSKRQDNWQGMNWIRPTTRLAIYLRDGLACVWCGDTLENAARLELDHLLPHSKGGDNKPINLVTTCNRCNASRGARTMASFAQAVAEYVDGEQTAASILNHISNCRRRKLPRAEARTIMQRRSSVRAAVQELTPTIS